MESQEKLLFIPIRYWLWLIALIFALSAALLVIAYSSAATTIGSSPDLAISMTYSPTTGVLSPGERRWFRITPANGEKYQEICLNMFYLADGGNGQPVNFQLYSSEEVEAWQRGLRGELSNFGAGMPLSRFQDPKLGERLWRGMMIRDTTYYLVVENPTALPVDYWLYDTEVLAPEFAGDEPSAPAPVTTDAGLAAAAPANEPADVVAAEPAASSPDAEATPMPAANAPDLLPENSPQTAYPLPLDHSTGTLGPGQEIWYSFAVNNYPEQFEPMALTMIMTPDDGNRIRNVAMEIFTKEGVKTWSLENKEAINNMGAGSVVYRDTNPLTGERFWNGWVVNDDVYYVRLSNSNVSVVDYWLFNGDVYNPTLGQ